MIPDAAVEAAARAICAIAFVEWTPHVVQNDEARVALAAAAPHIRAQALTEAVDAFPLETIPEGRSHHADGLLCVTT